MKYNDKKANQHCDDTNKKKDLHNYSYKFHLKLALYFRKVLRFPVYKCRGRFV